MVCSVFVKRSTLSAPAQWVFDWHLQPGAIQKLTPPWESVEVIDESGDLSQSGSQVKLRVKVLGPLSCTWVAEHRDFIPGRQFKDIQRQGPFAFWEHTHRVEPLSNHQCILEDRIEFVLPLSPLTRFPGEWLVQSKLKRMFEYRHAVIEQACKEHYAPLEPVLN